MCSWEFFFFLKDAGWGVEDGWGRWYHAVDPHACLRPQCLFLSGAELGGGALAQRARRVGELRESEDWSPLLLLRRWALEQDSEEGDGLSGSSMLG